MKAFLIAASVALAAPALAANPAQLLSGYESEARKTSPGFGASAARGEQFFISRHGAEWSCSSCHGAPPAAPGRHAKTGKTIAPLAPAANPERFTDATQAEKWFKRNCSDVLGRACTPAEKADVMAYLLRAGEARAR
jgi:hypothetical protein